MAENSEPPPPSSSSKSSLTASHPPTIILPPRSFAETLFNGGLISGSVPGFSPGPMTLVSSFFSDSDDCKSFSQLLAGAMASPAKISSNMPTLPGAAEKKSGEEVAGGDADFRLRQSRPDGLVIAQPPGMFTVPPGLSPATLLDSPRLFSPGQGHFGLTHQQALAQVAAQAAQAQPQTQVQTEYTSSLSSSTASLSQLSYFNAKSVTAQQAPPSVPDSRVSANESSDIPQSDQKEQASSFPVDKPGDDGYNWRKYGQKQVKGSEFPRSYYKCTHPNCPVKKQIERSLDGQVTEIIYKGQHNHQPPQPNKRTKNTGSLNGNSDHQGNFESTSQSQIIRQPSYSMSKDQESSRAMPDHQSGTSDSDEVGDAGTGIDGKDDDEPHPKRQNTEAIVSEPASSHRTVIEPRIIVQTTSEVDLLDDGYRWRKYGQKVVKGNPYPRSYYKCTTPGCNVRKHVERAAADPKAVITTYEGKHNHDVPAAKTSSHSEANSNASHLKPHNLVTENHAFISKSEYASNHQQPIARLRLKEEQIA